MTNVHAIDRFREPHPPQATRRVDRRTVTRMIDRYGIKFSPT